MLFIAKSSGYVNWASLCFPELLREEDILKDQGCSAKSGKDTGWTLKIKAVLFRSGCFSIRLGCSLEHGEYLRPFEMLGIEMYKVHQNDRKWIT